MQHQQVHWDVTSSTLDEGIKTFKKLMPLLSSGTFPKALQTMTMNTGTIHAQIKDTQKCA